MPLQLTLDYSTSLLHLSCFAYCALVRTLELHVHAHNAHCNHSPNLVGHPPLAIWASDHQERVFTVPVIVDRICKL
eukprot:6178465-Pleurochrysis_carterae.AAC.1